MEEALQGLNRRTLVSGALAAAAATPALAADNPLNISGKLVQGGAAVGRTAPLADIVVNGEKAGKASKRGFFVLGFDRDEDPRMTVEARTAQGPVRQTLTIAKGTFGVQRVDGVPPSTVAPSDPALLARIKREAEMKAAAYASVDDAEGFADGFAWPLEKFRVSSKFGNQRILNGVPNRPHFGVDLAAPAGTSIKAAADGLVVLASPDMHYEGGLTLIDHGQGLIAAYLHQSRILVKAGDRVVRGQRIGAVGMTGRATGPHLCWRLKWRGRNLDPSLFVRA